MPQPKTDYVFISYSRRDDAEMRSIVKFLRKQGINAWVDNEKLVPGTPIWESEIEKAIKGASAAVVILSPDAKESVWVLNELTLVDEYKKRIFPVLVRGDFRDSVPFRLATRQFVDLRNNDQVGLNALSAALGHYLDEIRKLEDNLQTSKEDVNQAVHEPIPETKNVLSAKENPSPKVKDEQVGPKRTPSKQSRAQVSEFKRPTFSKWIIFGIIGLFILAAGTWGIYSWARQGSSTLAPATQSETPEVSVTEAVTPTSTPTNIGTPDHPIKIFFVPAYVDTQVIMNDGRAMAEALNRTTGLNFEVIVPSSYSSMIEAMCATPFDSIGFIPAYGYVLANQLCDIDASFTMIRFGLPGYWTEILIRRDSNINSLSDLNGLTWGFPDTSSISGYLIPFAMFADYRIFPSEEISLGGHTTSVMAVYNGDVDFATTFYAPPLTTEGEYARTFDEYITGTGSLDIWDDPATIYPICENSNNKLLCNNWRVMDARASISEEFPDVIRKIRVLEISPLVPNDTVAFGAGFPLDLRVQIEEALNNYSQTDSWNNTFGSQDSYLWEGLYPITDTAYDLVRKMVEVTGLTIDSLNE